MMMIKNKKQTTVINSLSVIFDQTTMAQKQKYLHAQSILSSKSGYLASLF